MDTDAAVLLRPFTARDAPRAVASVVIESSRLVDSDHRLTEQEENIASSPLSRQSFTHAIGPFIFESPLPELQPMPDEAIRNGDLECELSGRSQRQRSGVAAVYGNWMQLC